MKYTGCCDPEVVTQLHNLHGERLRRRIIGLHEGALAVGKNPVEGSLEGRRCRAFPVRAVAEGPYIARPTGPTAAGGES